MLRWIVATACAVTLLGAKQDQPPPTGRPTDTQPATRPAGPRTMLRRPAQADILRKLIQRGRRPSPIRPQEPGRGAAAAEGSSDAQGQPLLPDGTFLVERPGRLVYEAGRPKLIFHAADGVPGKRIMEICPNRLLEAMEREAAAGFGEFIISAEVTRYKGYNYLILRKILRRVGHGNVGP